MHQAPDRTLTAAIYQTAAGRELRIHFGDNDDDLWHSLLSRVGDAPLEARATEALTVLLAVGSEQARRV